MNMCSNGHIEIVWDNGHNCPLCPVINDLAQMEENRDRLYEDLEDAKVTIKELQDELKDKELQTPFSGDR